MTKKKPSRVQQARFNLLTQIYALTLVPARDSERWLKEDAVMLRRLSTYTRVVRREERSR